MPAKSTAKFEYTRGLGNRTTWENWQTVARTYLRDYQTTMRRVADELGLPYGSVCEVLAACRETPLYVELCQRLQDEEDAELKDRKCGARTRTGNPCQAPGKGANGRCRMHGGLSTGPKSPEGKERARQAIIAYWERRRSEQAA